MGLTNSRQFTVDRTWNANELLCSVNWHGKDYSANRTMRVVCTRSASCSVPSAHYQQCSSGVRADGPRIVSPPLHAALALGDRTELSCAADSNPAASLAFYRGAPPSRDPSATPLAVARAGERALSLSLVALNVSYFGDYWCVARLNGFAPDSARAVLKVCQPTPSRNTPDLCSFCSIAMCRLRAGTRRARLQEHGQRALRRCASLRRLALATNAHMHSSALLRAQVSARRRG